MTDFNNRPAKYLQKVNDFSILIRSLVRPKAGVSDKEFVGKYRKTQPILRTRKNLKIYSLYI